MELIQVYNRATKQFAAVSPRSLTTWLRRGWEQVNPEPETVEDSAEDTPRRGKKPSARAPKDS